MYLFIVVKYIALYNLLYYRSNIYPKIPYEIIIMQARKYVNTNFIFLFQC